MNMQPTSVKRRFFAMMIDYWIFPSLIAFLLAYLLLLGFISYADYQSLIVIISMLQVFLFEQLFGQSIGKMMARTKVIAVNGKRPRFSQILIRNLARIIPFEAFSFLRRNPIGLHDFLSKTLVVNKKQINKLQSDNKETSQKNNEKIPPIRIVFFLLLFVISIALYYVNWRRTGNFGPEIEALKMFDSGLVGEGNSLIKQEDNNGVEFYTVKTIVEKPCGIQQGGREVYTDWFDIKGNEWKIVLSFEQVIKNELSNTRLWYTSSEETFNDNLERVLHGEKSSYIEIGDGRPNEGIGSKLIERKTTGPGKFRLRLYCWNANVTVEVQDSQK